MEKKLSPRKPGRLAVPESLRRSARLSMRTFDDVALKASLLGTAAVEALIRGAKYPFPALAEPQLR